MRRLALKCTDIICARTRCVQCFYNNTSILLYLLGWQVGGTAPLAPLNATDTYVYTPDYTTAIQ